MSSLVSCAREYGIVIFWQQYIYFLMTIAVCMLERHGRITPCGLSVFRNQMAAQLLNFW